MKIQRDLRAVLTSAGLWAGVWAALLVLITLLSALFRIGPTLDAQHLGRTLVARVGVGAVWGAIAGGAFAVALLLRRRRRTRGAPSTLRWLAWGAVVGLAVPGLAAGLTTLFSGILPPLPAWWLVFPAVGAATAGVLARIAGSTPAVRPQESPALPDDVSFASPPRDPRQVAQVRPQRPS